MIYLIVIDHKVQHDKKSPVTISFMKYLSEKIKEFKIDVVLEEFSKEALKRNDVNSTTTQDVAKLCGVKHRFCDPDSSKRKNWGYLRETK